MPMRTKSKRASRKDPRSIIPIATRKTHEQNKNLKK
jgi:hypothetical protein